MLVVFLLSFCYYSGIKGVCTGHNVMVVDDKLVTIPQFEFNGWTMLVNVTFSEQSDLTTIGDSAFRDCRSLQNINFPPKLETNASNSFLMCTALLRIHLPASLKTIGTHGFAGCSSVAYLTAEEGIQVTFINGYSFPTTNITTFCIWKKLTAISASAFSGCASLEEFTNPYGNPHFNVINGLLYQGTSVNIMPMKTSGHFIFPADVTSLAAESCRASNVDSISFETGSKLTSFGSACFISSKLSSFTFPDSTKVTSIGIQMFHDCRNLKSLFIPNQIITIGTSAFFQSAVSHLNVSNHPAFESVNGILFTKHLTGIVSCPPRNPVTTFVIPKEVTSIGATAFHGVHISSITFETGSALSSLGESAFAARGQKTFAFDPDCPLEHIPKSCFASASSMTIIELPRNLKTIDGSAFSDSGIEKFVIPDDSQYLISLDGVLYSRSMTTLVRLPPAMGGGQYEVPFSVETIGSFAFETCKGLTTLTFAANSRLSSVQSSAFASSTITTVIFGDDSDDVTFETGCFTSSSVKYITLPGRMEIIKQDMFKNCFNLVGITIPDTARSIGTCAFENCQSLTQLSMSKFCQIRTIPAGVFAGASSLKVLEIPYFVDTIAPNSLPSVLETVTLWCPLTQSVVNSIRTIPTLQNIHILCDLTLNTSTFVAADIVAVHHICFTKEIGRLGIGKPHLVITLLIPTLLESFYIIPKIVSV